MVDTKKKTVQIIGVPLDLGAPSLGVAVGPDKFREQQIIPKLTHAGIEVKDGGSIACTPRGQLDAGDPLIPYAAEIVRVNELLAEQTKQAVTAGEVVLALGGDHSINLGAFAGAAAACGGDIGMIYIDAHGDINTPETSISHNVHGMHLAALMGFGSPVLVNAYGEGAKLQTANLLHVGASDLDTGEEALIARENLTCFTMFDLLSHGLSPLLKLIDDLSQRVSHIWVSVDLDSIDNVYAPGVGIPSRNGFTYREIAAITEYIGKKCPVVGLDIVEYNPYFDIDKKTAELGIELTAKLLGTNYSWYTNYMDRNSDNGQYASINTGV